MNLEQIDTSTTAGKAEVMRLAAEGRRVAARRKIRLTDEWWEPGEANWNWSDIEFAIISEPVGPEEVWVTVADGKTAIDVYPSQDLAQPGPRAGWSAVRYLRADLAGEKG